MNPDPPRLGLNLGLVFLHLLLFKSVALSVVALACLPKPMHFDFSGLILPTVQFSTAATQVSL
jgi:hypothetical protein